MNDALKEGRAGSLSTYFGVIYQINAKARELFLQIILVLSLLIFSPFVVLKLPFHRPGSGGDKHLFERGGGIL